MLIVLVVFLVGKNMVPPVGLYVYVVFLMCFKTNHVQIHKSTPLLMFFP